MVMMSEAEFERQCLSQLPVQHKLADKVQYTACNPGFHCYGSTAVDVGTQCWGKKKKSRKNVRNAVVSRPVTYATPRLAGLSSTTTLAIMSLNALLDASKTSLLLSLASITFNPTAWNIVARNGKPGPPTRSHMTDQRRARVPQQDNHPLILR